MERLVAIIGISEMKLLGNEKIVTKNHVTYYSSINDLNHQYSVVLIAILVFVPYTERAV